MAQAKIKKEFLNHHVAFGGGGSALLGQRNDLDHLAIIALESGDPSLLQLFEQPIPSLDALRKGLVDEQLASRPKASGKTQ